MDYGVGVQFEQQGESNDQIFINRPSSRASVNEGVQSGPHLRAVLARNGQSARIGARDLLS
jgi:hypothetical protein